MKAVAVEVTGREEERVELGGSGGSERGCGAFGSEEEREALPDKGAVDILKFKDTGCLDEI